MMTATPSCDAAAVFADHRRSAIGFDDFPGAVPTSPAEAYAIQNAAIALWDKPIAGWKVGRTTDAIEKTFGENRFVGPIFDDAVWPVENDASAAFPAIRGGFAALEAELVAVIAAPGTRVVESAADCAALVRDWRVGIEVAGSPLSTINDLGPLASIAGFGNNMGLILGPRIALDDPDAASCTTLIDGRSFGPRQAGTLPGGPLTAIAFAIAKLRSLGHEIPDGTLISTGAITGVHAVSAGQLCEVRFADGPTLHCRVEAA